MNRRNSKRCPRVVTCRSALITSAIPVVPNSKDGLFLSDEGPMLETLDYTMRIGSTPTILYFDLYLYSAYAEHYVYLKFSFADRVSRTRFGG